MWQRGPTKDNTKVYSVLEGESSVDMEESHNKVSGFYMNKKLEVQKKTCDFILMKGNKNLQTISVDMA